jgi:hypothetical protein
MDSTTMLPPIAEKVLEALKMKKQYKSGPARKSGMKEASKRNSHRQQSLLKMLATTSYEDIPMNRTKKQNRMTPVLLLFSLHTPLSAISLVILFFFS